MVERGNWFYIIENEGFFATDDGWLLHKLAGKQLRKAVVCANHETRLRAQQFVLVIMALHRPQGITK